MHRATPTVSVLMPAKDAMPYLTDAVHSILAQEFVDFEFIIIDDGSADGSWDWLCAQGDPRIRLVRHDQPRRLIATLNEGLKLCRAPLIARMDADDLASPRRLGMQVRQFAAEPSLVLGAASIEYFGSRSGVARVPRSEEAIKASMLFATTLVHTTAMMRRRTLEQHDLLYPEKFIHAEDYALWLLLAQHGRLGGHTEVLGHVRVHAASVSQQNMVEQITNADLCRLQAVRQFLGVDAADQERMAHKILSGVGMESRATSTEVILSAARWRGRLEAAAAGRQEFQALLASRWRGAMRRARPRAALEAILRDPESVLASSGWHGAVECAGKFALAPAFGCRGAMAS